jgi:hypothetical protein
MPYPPRVSDMIVSVDIFTVAWPRSFANALR